MPNSRYKWLVVAVTAILSALNYADRSAVSSVFPLIRSDLKSSDLELAGLNSFFLWAYAVSSPIAGLLADRFSRSSVIVWSVAGWSVVTLASGFASNIHQLLWMRTALGCLESAYIPASVALIADYHLSATRATAMGINAAGLAVGVVVGGVSFGYLGDHFGWRPGFAVLGMVGLLLALGAGFLLHDQPSGPSFALGRVKFDMAANLLSLARTPSYVTLIAANMFIAFGHWIFLTWLPLFFRETYQMSLTGAGFAGTFIIQGAGFIGGLAGSVFSDRIASKAPHRRMLILIASCLVSAPFLLIFFVPQANLTLLKSCIFAYSFIHVFGVCNLTPLMCDLLRPALRSTAVGLCNTVSCMAGGIGVLITGLLMPHLGLGSAFGGISVMLVICAGLLITGYLLFIRRDLARC